MSKEIRRVAVAGTGMMGPGIAATFALSGRETLLVGRSADKAAAAVATARQLIARLVQNGLADPLKAERAASLLSPSTDPELAAAAVQLFVESIAEDLGMKQDYFARLDAAAPETILCSNTSGLSVTAIASKCRNPGRVLTTHFWNPPYLIPLVEVIMGRASDAAVAESVMACLASCGKVPVLVRKDVPGQLGNRIQHAMIRECIHIVEEGIASPEDVDLAVKAGFGLRLPVYGVFEHADLVGLELVKTVQDTILPDLGAAQGASRLHEEKIARGETGAAAGRGFLQWPQGKAERVKAVRDDFIMEFLRLRRAGRFS